MVKGGPSNPRLTGEKAAVAELIHLIEGVLDIAERAPTDVRSVVLALAGVETEADAARFGVAYHATDETFQRCTLIVNDAVAAWAAATECQPGIGLIAGTGSHAFGVGPSGQYASCGGWGHFLGDEGSGYWMGREALRHLTRSVDGRASSVSLVDAILRRLDVRSVEELLASTRESEPPKREVAALAPEVIGLARDGDPTCLTIVSQAALFLAELVASVVAHAEIDLTTYPVGVVGGLTDGRDVLFPDLESNLSELVGVQVNLQLAPLEPCDGAVALAAQAVDSAPRALAQLRSNAMTPA